jgi:hypothetical protein
LCPAQTPVERIDNALLHVVYFTSILGAIKCNLLSSPRLEGRQEGWGKRVARESEQLLMGCANDGTANLSDDVPNSVLTWRTCGANDRLLHPIPNFLYQRTPLGAPLPILIKALALALSLPSHDYRVASDILPLLFRVAVIFLSVIIL